MLNMDFTQRVVIDTHAQPWIASPRAGVWRKPLAREEAERGHATSIVRYEAGASFHGHNHPGGEEILVLEGTFSDETGDFHAGTYFRNPLGFRHAPFSREGCLILVKLHQFQTDDDLRLAIEPATAHWQPLADGSREAVLHTHGSERVTLLELPAGTGLAGHDHPAGEELFVLRGLLSDDQGRYPAGTWLRQPAGSRHAPHADQATLLWIKSGHLPPADARPTAAGRAPE
jgi:anti-sigma factor ChrR (cupin superfamily)